MVLILHQSILKCTIRRQLILGKTQLVIIDQIQYYLQTEVHSMWGGKREYTLRKKQINVKQMMMRCYNLVATKGKY